MFSLKRGQLQQGLWRYKVGEEGDPALDRLGRVAAAAHARLQHEEPAHYGLSVGGNLSINPV